MCELCNDEFEFNFEDLIVSIPDTLNEVLVNIYQCFACKRIIIKKIRYKLEKEITFPNNDDVEVDPYFGISIM